MGDANGFQAGKRWANSAHCRHTRLRSSTRFRYACAQHVFDDVSRHPRIRTYRNEARYCDCVGCTGGPLATQSETVRRRKWPTGSGGPFRSPGRHHGDPVHEEEGGEVMHSPFEGKLVRLRAREPGDEPLLYRWFNDPEVTEHLTVRYPLSHAQEKAFIEGAAAVSYDRATFGVE